MVSGSVNKKCVFHRNPILAEGCARMVWESPKGMDEYLRPTELCDCNDPAIRRRAQEIIKDIGTPKEAALLIFHHVRDRILFALDNLDVKASDTLRKGFGLCVGKTNLQVALLRSVGIPARYHQVVLSKNCLKGIVSSTTFNGTPERIWWHPWCECYISGRWMACETLFDKRLYEACLERGIITREQIPTIDWDGENDVIQVTPWILEDRGTHHNLDEEFRRAQKEAMPPRIIANMLLYFTNRYTNKLRSRGRVQ